MKAAAAEEQLESTNVREADWCTKRFGATFWSMLRRYLSLSERHAQRKIRIAERASLGEKRFVAILEIDGRRMLIGGGSDSVALLTCLSGEAVGSSSASGVAS